MSLDGSGLKKYIKHFLWEYKVYFASLMAVAICAGIFEISVDYKIKEIIDAISYDKSAQVGLLLGLFVLYKLLYHGIYFVRRLLNIQYKPAMMVEMFTNMYRKTAVHSLHWFDSHLSGEISNKIADFQHSIIVIFTRLFKIFQTIVTIIITLFFLAKVNILTALVLLLFVMIYTPVLYYLLTKQMHLQEVYMNKRQQVVGEIYDSISNMFSIKVIGDVSTDFNTRLKPAIAELQSKDIKRRKFDAYYVDTANVVMMTIMSAVQIYLLAYLYQNGDITAGGFAFVAMMTLKIHKRIEIALQTLLFYINPSIARAKSSYAFINEAVDVKDAPDAIQLSNVKGDIKYKDVSFYYDPGMRPVLQNVSLHIRPGERIGVVGTSGTGKTTMIKCLLRYFDVSDGAILLDGHDIRDVTQESLRSVISVIPQNATLLHQSVRENLKLAKHDATEAEIIDACKKARIHDVIMAMPQGYDSTVGEKGSKLSGGQRQRLAIAQAILKQSSILVLDEATSSLDVQTEQLIQESINELLEHSKSTVIAIAHRLSTLKHMDKIVVFDKGTIVESGTHDELIKKKGGTYRMLWEMQAI